MFLQRLPTLSKIKKTLGSRSKPEKDFDHFDLELLNNQRCIRCCYCDQSIMLINHTPLAMENCEHCLSTNFIPSLIKDYWLMQPLGGGGMGCVYQAIHQTDYNRRYAIKILQKSTRGTRFFIETLLKEAQIGKRLGKHPHLIEVVDYGHYNNDFFSIMTYANGRRLDLLINSPELISNAYILLWIMQILSAEKHIHDCGYLFRDLKPENIIIDFSGNVKLFDFGLTLPLEEATNEGSDIVDGSPLYIPPERIAGRSEDLRSEIYSLGMIMFHLFTKTPYYTGKNANDIVIQHIKDDKFKDIESRMPESAPPEISPIIRKMTAKLPIDRYQSFERIASEIMKIYRSCFKDGKNGIKANIQK